MPGPTSDGDRDLLDAMDRDNESVWESYDKQRHEDKRPTTYCKHCEHKIDWGRDATVNHGGIIYHTLCWGQAMHAALKRIVDTDTHGKNVRDEHGTVRPTGQDFCGRCNRNSFHPHADDCPIALAAKLLDA